MTVFNARRPGDSPRYLVASVVTLALVTILTLRCTELDRPFSSDVPPIVQKGRQLAQTHCQSCHLPVSPTSLDSTSWVNGVLPAMAPHMGIQVLWDNDYYNPDGRQPAESDSTVTLPEWRAIIAYFKSQAPDTLQLPNPPDNLQKNLPGFSVRRPRANRRPPATAMVKIDPLRHHIYSSNVTSERLFRWDSSLTRTSLKVPTQKGVDLQFVRDSTGLRHAVLTSIGTMRAINVATGSVQNLNLDTGSSQTLAEKLPRPVCALPGDYNRDGLRDWVVCGFGHDIGGLYLLEQQPNHTFQKTILRNVPGAVDAETGDFNHDGRLDVMVLFGHAKEGVWLFLNDKRGEFEKKNLIRFPPHYGSSSLQVTDFNNDGRPDLLYTSGDNADYSTILKKFHGAYVYINQGDFQYEKRAFFHLNGATEAIARDFDEDGDLDIAVIGFFADINDPSAQDFVYLEQTDAMEFVPYAPPIADQGRWISMDAGDYDDDEDLDLVLGNFARRYAGTEDTPRSLRPFLVLENNLR